MHWIPLQFCCKDTFHCGLDKFISFLLMTYFAWCVIYLSSFSLFIGIWGKSFCLVFMLIDVLLCPVLTPLISPFNKSKLSLLLAGVKQNTTSSELVVPKLGRQDGVYWESDLWFKADLSVAEYGRGLGLMAWLELDTDLGKTVCHWCKEQGKVCKGSYHIKMLSIKELRFSIKFL